MTVGCQAVMAHAFNPSTLEAEAGISVSSRPAWSTRASSRPQTYREILSQKTKRKKKKILGCVKMTVRAN